MHRRLVLRQVLRVVVGERRFRDGSDLVSASKQPRFVRLEWASSGQKFVLRAILQRFGNFYLIVAQVLPDIIAHVHEELHAFVRALARWSAREHV